MRGVASILERYDEWKRRMFGSGWKHGGSGVKRRREYEEMMQGEKRVKKLMLDSSSSVRSESLQSNTPFFSIFSPSFPQSSPSVSAMPSTARSTSNRPQRGKDQPAKFMLKMLMNAREQRSQVPAMIYRQMEDSYYDSQQDPAANNNNNSYTMMKMKCRMNKLPPPLPYFRALVAGMRLEGLGWEEVAGQLGLAHADLLRVCALIGYEDWQFNDELADSDLLKLVLVVGSECERAEDGPVFEDLFDRLWEKKIYVTKKRVRSITKRIDWSFFLAVVTASIE